MKKYLLDILNGIVIVLGACALADVFDDHLNKVFLGIAAGFGAVYLFISILLFFICPVKFDWHLVRGNYILKVLAFVLYTPFVMTGAYCLWSEERSPMALTYEENLYKEVKQDGICPAATTNLPDEIRNKQEDPSLFWSVYYHYIDPGNQHMTTTPDGRLWAAIIGILGVFLVNGLLVSAIIGWIDIRKEKWLKGEVKYPILLWFWEHYVIIGGNDMVAGIVRQLLESKEYRKSFLKPYILIQTNRDVEDFRRELFSGFTEKQQRRIIVYYGGRTSEDDIAELQLRKAKEVYILGEDTRTDDIESYHDTMNMHCLKLVSEQIKEITRFQKDAVKGDNRLVCRVMFEYQTTFNIFQVTDIDGSKIKFLPFNYYEMWAQKVLVCKELGKEMDKYSYLPLEGKDGIRPTDEDFVHFVVVGMSRMGLAMAIEAAHLAHYPNFVTNQKRTRITFIDSNMEQEKHFFMGRFKEMFAVACYRDVYKASENIYSDTDSYPWLDPLVDEKCKSPYRGDYLGTDFVDVEWEFVNGPIENPNVQQYLVDAASNPHAKLTIAVCLPENSRAIAAAAYLPDDVYSSDRTLQVLVYQRFNDELLGQISKNNFRYHRKLRAFGMKDQGYDATLVELSEYIGDNHINKAYDDYQKKKEEKIKAVCQKQSAPEEKCSSDGQSSNDSEGKSKMAKWWSNKYNIYTMWTKIRCISADREMILNGEFDNTMLPDLGKMEHNRWVVEQLLLRYRPLKIDEQKMAMIPNLCSPDTEKDRLKKKEYAHLDICSNEKLDVIDYKASELDQVLIKVLPGAYRDYLKKKKEEDPAGNKGNNGCSK